ncbi:PaaI family thioesterase [Acetobacterium tundrae]|uniref:Hotdog fold thioesterase n=1 Tax=Acetobacterium tundrae TaxID=132932 RepID=A0ABR6WII4_9FIRM|nr:PaaI family thioesterase [Acetobacterium tundrae]MBC3796304.1 hotdog fold thioesterase [Acetobacterium tundrae]
MDKDMIKTIENDRFANSLGIKLVKVDHGYAEVKMEIKEVHLNGVNIVQGGVIFTLADYAFAAASNTKGLVTVGINASISYFKSPQGKWLFAKAKEISSTRSICNYTVDIFDETDEIIARFNGTGYIKRPR